MQVGSDQSRINNDDAKIDLAQQRVIVRFQAFFLNIESVEKDRVNRVSQ